MRFASRRFRSISIVLLAILLIWTGHQAVRVALYQEQFLTGWILAAVILVLVFYNIRKKISVLPIGSASTWLQMHIYLGLVSIFLFFLHTGWRFPSGWLESLLAFLFLGVSLSGVVGLYLNRRLSKLLTRRGKKLSLSVFLDLSPNCVTGLKRLCLNAQMRPVHQLSIISMQRI